MGICPGVYVRWVFVRWVFVLIPLLFNRFIIDKVVLQMYVLPNMEHIISEKSLKRENCSLFTSIQKTLYKLVHVLPVEQYLLSTLSCYVSPISKFALNRIVFIYV